MNEAHIHLLFNHFPITGLMIAIGILAYGLFTQNRAVANTGLVVAIFMTILSFPAYFSGEEAEHMVEDMAGTNEYYLEEHEEIASTAFYVLIAAGVLSLVAVVLNRMRRSLQKTITGVALAALLVAFGLMAYTGFLGGKIRHPELIDGATPAMEHHDDHD